MQKQETFSEFQSTPPARGATVLDEIKTFYGGFQSTPPARGATTKNCRECSYLWISIHAPREGGDTYIPLRMGYI